MHVGPKKSKMFRSVDFFSIAKKIWCFWAFFELLAHCELHCLLEQYREAGAEVGLKNPCYVVSVATSLLTPILQYHTAGALCKVLMQQFFRWRRQTIRNIWMPYTKVSIFTIYLFNCELSKAILMLVFFVCPFYLLRKVPHYYIIPVP